MEKARQISAKFASTCPSCGRPIAIGTLVNWVRGEKATHAECPSRSVAVPAPVAGVAADGARIMYSKYVGKCKRCGGRIEVGDKITWAKAAGAIHVPGECAGDTRQAGPVAAPVKRIPADEIGVYVLPDGALVRVKANHDKTATYAYRLVEINAQRVRQVDGERVNFKWVYERGLIDQVAAEGRRMNLQEAKQYGLRYGRCLRCGLKIVAANSVLAGIGPVCIKWFGETQLERIDRLAEAAAGQAVLPLNGEAA